MRFEVASKSRYAVRTKPRKEHYAKEQFERQGYEVYLPRTLSLTSHARKKSWVSKPFFPGYLFLNLECHERNWVSIASTYGAIGAVSFGSYYPHIPDEVVDGLKGHEDENGVILCESTPEAPFRTEQRIRVLDGPMEDLEGVFRCMSGRDRVLVLMEFLNRSVEVRVPLNLVAAC